MPLCDVVTDLLVVRAYYSDGDWQNFAVCAGLLVGSSIISGLTAASVFFPAADGLDFGQPSEEQRFRDKQSLIKINEYDRRVTFVPAFTAGFFSVATTIQCVNDVFIRGHASVSMGALRFSTAITESSSQLYVQLAGLVAGGIRLAWAHDPIKFVSIGFSAFSMCATRPRAARARTRWHAR